jgi:hypothetical protein
MKALSIKQPWAAAIIYGGKDIENRNWKTKFRGRFLVHAGLGVDRKAPQHVWDIFEKHFSDLKAHGGIIGIVEIIDCVDKSDSHWFQGKYGFVLKNPQPLEFVEYKGQLNFFEVKL